MDKLKYRGDSLKEKRGDLKLDVYDPSPSLVEAVNLAVLLEQPLLLMGEPGSGKTRLAEAVASEFHGSSYENHYFRWDVKSTAKAKDGLYEYDALGRMYDANSGNPKAQFAKEYVTYGKFANALTKPQNGSLPNVLLIDEIDKADIDFPNDLLLEIEKGEFHIQELNEKIKKTSQVIIFITSNRERELPPAFLRRCIYHYISFPKQSELENIINAKFGNNGEGNLVENAVNLFLDIREKLDGQFAETEKKPSTSELLEWYSVIHYYHNLKQKKSLPEDARSNIEVIEHYKQGNVENIVIPFPQLLLKTWESSQVFNTGK